MSIDTSKLTVDQPLEDRKTVLDIAVKKCLAEVLEDNMGNRLTPALVSGLVGVIAYQLIHVHKITDLPPDIVERLKTLEAHFQLANTATDAET